MNSDAMSNVCRLTGMDQKLRTKLLTLKDLEQTLQQALLEVTKADDDLTFWQAMEVCTKLVQVSCDFAVFLLEKSASKTPGAFAAKAIAILYDEGKHLATALTGTYGAADGLMRIGEIHAEVIAHAVGGRGEEAIANAKQLITMSTDLYRWFSDGGKETLRADSNLVGARKTVAAQLMLIRRQIQVAERSIDNCALGAIP